MPWMWEVCVKCSGLGCLLTLPGDLPVLRNLGSSGEENPKPTTGGRRCDGIMEMPPRGFQQEVHRNAIGGIWGSTVPFGFTPNPVILGTEESLMIGNGSPNLLYLVAGSCFSFNTSP